MTLLGEIVDTDNNVVGNGGKSQDSGNNLNAMQLGHFSEGGIETISNINSSAPTRTIAI